MKSERYQAPSAMTKRYPAVGSSDLGKRLRRNGSRTKWAKLVCILPYCHGAFTYININWRHMLHQCAVGSEVVCGCRHSQKQCYRLLFSRNNI